MLRHRLQAEREPFYRCKSGTRAFGSRSRVPTCSRVSRTRVFGNPVRKQSGTDPLRVPPFQWICMRRLASTQRSLQLHLGSRRVPVESAAFRGTYFKNICLDLNEQVSLLGSSRALPNRTTVPLEAIVHSHMTRFRKQRSRSATAVVRIAF